MNKAKKTNQIPDKSIIQDRFGKIDYFDTFYIDIISDNTVDAITTELFNTPKWVNNLMKLRNFIVGKIGLKTSNIETSSIKQIYSIGEKAIRFVVINRNENEIVMAKEDKHLDFRTSVYVQKNNSISTVYLSTIIQFNNMFGRMYFFLVKPFHWIMIKSILTRLVK